MALADGVLVSLVLGQNGDVLGGQVLAAQVPGITFSAFSTWRWQFWQVMPSTPITGGVGGEWACSLYRP